MVLFATSVGLSAVLLSSIALSLRRDSPKLRLPGRLGLRRSARPQVLEGFPVWGLKVESASLDASTKHDVPWAKGDDGEKMCI